MAGDTDDDLACEAVPDMGPGAEIAIEYRDTPARTRRVAALYLALMACIREISKKIPMTSRCMRTRRI